MKRMLWTYSLLFLTFSLFSPYALAQDLDKLHDRAELLWAERAKGDRASKSKAAEFISREFRNNFPMYPEVKGPAVTGLGFTDDKNRVLVSAKGTMFIPNVGEFPQEIVEPWVWANGNWFVEVKWAQEKDPFTINKEAPTAKPREFLFTLTDTQIDLGPHKQGDVIKGTIRFQSTRADLRSVRARGLAGLRLAAPKWTDDNNGTIELTLDSTLFHQDIQKEVTLEAVGPAIILDAFETRLAKLNIAAKIEGKLRLTQLPQSAQAQKDHIVEIEIQNLGSAPLQIKDLRPISTNYMVAESAPNVTVRPGQTEKFAVLYPNSPVLTDGEVQFDLSSGVLPGDKVLFRIETAASQITALPGGPTRADIDALVQRALQEAGQTRQQP